MAFVETQIHGQIMVVQINRPERLNAISQAVREEMAAAFREYRDNDNYEVAILTGTGRSFCAGEDMKEALDRGAPVSPKNKLRTHFGTARWPNRSLALSMALPWAAGSCWSSAPTCA